MDNSCNYGGNTLKRSLMFNKYVRMSIKGRTETLLGHILWGPTPKGDYSSYIQYVALGFLMHSNLQETVSGIRNFNPRLLVQNRNQAASVTLCIYVKLSTVRSANRCQELIIKLTAGGRQLHVTST